MADGLTRREDAEDENEGEAGAVVLDIGANVGAHTLPLAQLVGPQGRVYAMEPTTFAFEKLIANLALNAALVPRVTPLQAFIVPSDVTVMNRV